MSASELWFEALTDAAEIDGDTIHAALTVDLDIDSVVTVAYRRVNPDRLQGIALDADHACTIADQHATRMVLWADTAPEVVEVHVPAGRLTIWNVWRDDGTMHAWTGAAGIRRVELDDAEADFGVRLLASDGYEDTDLDLEFDVTISGAGPSDTPSP